VIESAYDARVSFLFSAKMTEQLKQRYCVKFCQKLGDSQEETIWKVQRVFGDDAMGITQIKEWYNRFKDGRTSVESDARSGWLSTSRNDELIDQVRTLVMQDHRVTVRELAEEVAISSGSVHSILTDDLTMRRVSAKFMTTHQLIPRN
jgi:histone-lysine N-methyltransferase SETMAR